MIPTRPFLVIYPCGGPSRMARVFSSSSSGALKACSNRFRSMSPRIHLPLHRALAGEGREARGGERGRGPGSGGGGGRRPLVGWQARGSLSLHNFHAMFRVRITRRAASVLLRDLRPGRAGSGASAASATPEQQLPPPQRPPPPPQPHAGAAERRGLSRASRAVTSLSLPPTESPDRSRGLSCCLIGPTNAGKSTLLNALLNARVSTVSDRIHTTRANTLGYLTDAPTRTQVEFIDAPGALGPDVPALHRACWDAVHAVELALVVVDASDRRSHGQVGRFLSRLARELEAREAACKGQTETALVLNKVDLVAPKSRLLRLSDALHRDFGFDWPPFMLSAATGSGTAGAHFFSADASVRHPCGSARSTHGAAGTSLAGVHHLREWLLLHSTPRAWAAPAGTTHVQPPLERATELIREQVGAMLAGLSLISHRADPREGGGHHHRVTTAVTTALPPHVTTASTPRARHGTIMEPPSESATGLQLPTARAAVHGRAAQLGMDGAALGRFAHRPAGRPRPAVPPCNRT